MIGFYSGIGWFGLHRLDDNRGIVQGLVSQGVKHHLRFEVKFTQQEISADHWGMLEEEGFTAGVRMDGDHQTEWGDPIYLAAYSFLNGLPASHIYFGHEILEYLTWEDRAERRALYNTYFPDLAMIQYYGGLWIPLERVGKTHPNGGLYNDYVFGNEANKFQGSKVIIHISLGGYDDDAKFEPLIQDLAQNIGLLNWVSPHGHPLAVHLNVRDDVSSSSKLTNILKYLYTAGAAYVYVRPVDGAGQKVDATQIMIDAVGTATNDLGL